MIRHRKKHLISWCHSSLIFLLLSGYHLYVKAHEQEPIGKLVNSYGLEVRLEHSSQKTFISRSSPSIVIGQSKDNDYRLLMPDSRIAWSKSIPTSENINIFAKGGALKITTRPFSDKSDQGIEWETVKSTEKIKLTGASKNKYEQTPDYIKNNGRMLFLPPQLNYYQLPQLHLKFSDTAGWGFSKDLIFKSPQPSANLKLAGLIKGPFLSLATENRTGSKPHSSLTFRNLALYEIENITVKNVKWNLEALIIPPPDKEQKLTSIAFYSGSKNSYLYVINWTDKKSQYLGYSGILFEGPEHQENIYPIDIPVILEYDVKDIDKDGNNEILLHLIHIGGDENTEEWIEFNGKYLPERINYSLMRKASPLWSNSN